MTNKTKGQKAMTNKTKGQKAMTNKTITITDLADVRDGDICTVEIDGRRYTGPAYAGGGDSTVLLWGGYLLRYSSGEPDAFAVFLSATRETPSLPTERGSAIFIHEAVGTVCDPPVLAVHDGTDHAPWSVARRIDGLSYLGDEDITRWQECDVTPRGEVIGR